MANTNDKRRDATNGQRTDVINRDNGRCVVCGCFDAALLQCDHATAYAVGGRTTVANLQAMCPPCNKAKGDLSVDRMTGFNMIDQTNGQAIVEALETMHDLRAAWAVRCEMMRADRVAEATKRAIELWQTRTAGGNKRTKYSVLKTIAREFGKTAKNAVAKAI